MTYSYERKTPQDIEEMASTVRSQYPSRRREYAIDIELILDDTNIDIVYRRGIARNFEGYLSRDRNKIVVDETLASNPARFRFTLAEEFCHRVLEAQLWTDSELCDRNRCDRLSYETHKAIEKDACKLAGALLMPKDDFCSLYKAKDRQLHQLRVNERDRIKNCLMAMGRIFEVSDHAAAIRAMDVGLLPRRRLNELFPP